MRLADREKYLGRVTGSIPEMDDFTLNTKTDLKGLGNPAGRSRGVPGSQLPAFPGSLNANLARQEALFQYDLGHIRRENVTHFTKNGDIAQDLPAS